jgi:hypothetical protein
VIEGQDAVVEGQGEELTLGRGERGERGGGEVSMRERRRRAAVDLPLAGGPWRMRTG